MTNTVWQKGHPYEYKPVNPTLILIDPLYQRELNTNQVNKIVINWNYDLVNEPKLSQREDGRLFAFDGQRTTAAWRIHEGENTPIMCKIFRGLSWDDEKELFINQNGISTDPTTFEKLRAEFNGGNKDVRDMVEAAAEAGVQITFKTKGSSFARCVAVSSVFTAYKTLQRKDFVAMMELITAAWQGQIESYQAGFIKGMCNIFKKHSGKFAMKEMRKSLERNSPSYYIREAKDMNGSLAMRYEKLFVREYNKHRSSNRIEMDV